MSCRMTDQRCPRCGASLNTNGKRAWCSFVGGRGGGVVERACSFGLYRHISPAAAAVLAEVARLIAANPGRTNFAVEDLEAMDEATLGTFLGDLRECFGEGGGS